jgi:hypothetical protein|tara:strand:+ start:1391 stop:3301 length:1911 start_codon:yes stop_codon:yes gene_type:complete
MSRIHQEITDSLGYDGEISIQREEAIKYYYALPFGNEVDGRSQYVDSTVQDTIEWIKPSLMRVFASGDEMVKFTPHGPEDVQAAEQATDYVNYVFTKDNPGWEILYSWFHDALLQKNGIVKVWWDEYPETQREEYRGLTDMEFEVLTANKAVEVIEHEEYYEDVTYHNIVIHRGDYNGKIKIENVPPDEFLISREAKGIQDARFVCHRVRKTVSELREMYGDDWDVGELGAGYNAEMYNAERLARYEFDDSNQWSSGLNETGEEALREYWLHESFIKTDYDDDGIAELRKVCSVGDYIFSNEEVDKTPFVSITPLKIPHKFFGMSVADLVMDLQLIKSTLMRNLMDNAYNQNFGRYAVLEGQANLDDLLTQRPGGVVRVKSPNAVMPLATPPLQPESFQMLGYLDDVRESRTGVNKNTQGLNADALTSHTTATAVNAVMSNAQSRVELIARQFAETGVKELMRCIYELLLKNQDKERVVMLRNQWVPVRPDMWNDKMDCTVSVALGNGSKDQQMAHLSQMLQFAGQAMQGGLPIVTPQNMYNLGAALVKAMGYQNVDDYLTPPPPPQPNQPTPEQQNAMMEQQIKMKELEIKQGDLQVKMMKVQQDAEEAAIDAQLKTEELALEREQKRAVAIGAT